MKKIYYIKGDKDNGSLFIALTLRSLCKKEPKEPIYYLSAIKNGPKGYGSVIELVNNFEPEGHYTIKDKFFQAEKKICQNGGTFYEIYPTGICLPGDWFESHVSYISKKIQQKLRKSTQ